MSEPVVQTVYGIRIRTPWPIPALPHLVTAEWDVEFLEGAAEDFAQAARYVAPAHRRRSAQYAKLPDGSRYRRWANLLELLISPDARVVHARAMPNAHPLAFQTYLLVDALLFVMIRMGREPLHATAVHTGHGIIAFAGASGLGKSTLGALLVRAGYRLVTDDMLVLAEAEDGFVAYPGPPRVKLYRETADRIFEPGYFGMAMKPTTDKLLIPLGPSQATQGPLPFHTLYLLKPNDDRAAGCEPCIRKIRPAEAVAPIVALTSGYCTDERERLARQFRFVTRFVQSAVVKTLSYTREPAAMAQLRQAVIDDVASAVP